LAVRVTQIEEQMRLLMGQVEELTFEVKQLRSQLGAKSGAVEQPTQPLQRQSQMAAAEGADIGIEKIEDLPIQETQADQPIVTTIIKEDGSEEQIVLNKAPGPKILGTLSNSAATPGDGGFQGQILVPPSQQERDLQPEGLPAAESDTIETVALSPESPEALYERSNESLLRRQFGEAEAGFRKFLDKYPDHGLAGSAQYWLGETYYAQQDFRQAAQAFLRGYRQYPKSRRAADSLLKLGISLGRLGQKQQACAAYSAVSGEYPKAVEARKRAQAEAKRAGCES
jgi:tol-pal system protein YbgF